MPGLISDSLMHSMRLVAYKQLITTCRVYRTSPVEGPTGTDDVESLALTTLTWFKPSYKGSLAPGAGNLTTHDSTSEFRFRFDDDIQVGDRLEVNGHPHFVVQDTNGGASIQLYLKAWAIRVEPYPDG